MLKLDRMLVELNCQLENDLFLEVANSEVYVVNHRVLCDRTASDVLRLVYPQADRQFLNPLVIIADTITTDQRKSCKKKKSPRKKKQSRIY